MNRGGTLSLPGPPLRKSFRFAPTATKCTRQTAPQIPADGHFCLTILRVLDKSERSWLQEDLSEVAASSVFRGADMFGSWADSSPGTCAPFMSRPAPSSPLDEDLRTRCVHVHLSAPHALDRLRTPHREIPGAVSPGSRYHVAFNEGVAGADARAGAKAKESNQNSSANTQASGDGFHARTVGIPNRVG